MTIRGISRAVSLRSDLCPQECLAVPLQSHHSLPTHPHSGITLSSPSTNYLHFTFKQRKFVALQAIYYRLTSVVTRKVCDESYSKKCRISFSSVAQNTTVSHCYRPVRKKCGGSGPRTCVNTLETHCTSKYDEKYKYLSVTEYSVTKERAGIIF